MPLFLYRLLGRNSYNFFVAFLEKFWYQDFILKLSDLYLGTQKLIGSFFSPLWISNLKLVCASYLGLQLLLLLFGEIYINVNIQITCPNVLYENSSKEEPEQARLYKFSIYRNRIVPSNDDTRSILNHFDNGLTPFVAEMLESWSAKNIKSTSQFN